MYCSCAPHPREDNHSILVRGIDVSIWLHSVLPLLHGQRPSFSLCSHLYQSWWRIVTLSLFAAIGRHESGSSGGENLTPSRSDCWKKKCSSPTAPLCSAVRLLKKARKFSQAYQLPRKLPWWERSGFW